MKTTLNLIQIMNNMLKNKYNNNLNKIIVNKKIIVKILN